MANIEGAKFVHFEKRERVGWITLDRPPANVMNIEMLTQMENTIAVAANDDQLMALVLGANGKLFSAGVDVADHTVEKVAEMIPLFDRVCVALSTFPVATIAAVQGHALGGGCELVICCDFAIMAAGRRIGQPEISLASLAPIAVLRLPDLVGPRNAASMLFTGEQLDAEAARRIGLIDQVVPMEHLDEAVWERLEPISKLSIAAIRHNKQALLLAGSQWQEKIPAIEELYLQELMATQDAQEGLRAFLEKRTPNWLNR